MIALLYDVHGNLPALEAVLEDAQDAGATEWIVGGDVALFGAYPAETVSRLRELEHSRWLRGNGERWAAATGDLGLEEPVPGAVRAVRAALGDAQVEELGNLPECLAIGPGARAWHGSPVSDVRSFLPEPGPDDDELLAGVTERRLVFGHTHVPFRRTHGGIDLINPGSVGAPLDGDRRAAYALLHDDGGVEHRRVEYPVDDVIAALRANHEGAWVDAIAGRLERARL